MVRYIPGAMCQGLVKANGNNKRLKDILMHIKVISQERFVDYLMDLCIEADTPDESGYGGITITTELNHYHQRTKEKTSIIHRLDSPRGTATLPPWVFFIHPTPL